VFTVAVRQTAIIISVTALWLAGTFQALAGEDSRSEARFLVQRCLKLQSLMDRVSMQVETDLQSLTPVKEGRPSHFRDESMFRRDGDLFDRAGKYLFVDKKKDRSFQYRMVINKKYWIYYTFEFSKYKEPKHGGSASTQRSKMFERFAKNFLTSSALDGDLPYTGGQRLARCILDAPNLHMRAGETIETIPCKVVQAKTRFGTIALWIAESKGYATMKFVFDKSAEDIFDDDKPLSKTRLYSVERGEKESLVHWSAVLDDVSVDKIDNAFVPVAGRLTITQRLSGGSEIIHQYIYKRTDVKLNPNFDETDAFVTDLAEGSQISNEDDRKSGVQYVWRNGEVVPAYSEFTANAHGFWGGRSLLVILCWAAVGLLLLCVAGWMIIRLKSKKGA
jgi:hypothetical protein